MDANLIRLIPKLSMGYEDGWSHPNLEILEQPAEFYRFRYESEITEGRVGGLLLGRSSSGNNKSFIKVRISGISPQLHKCLQLTVCTVNPDRAPHPYYLHGDGCQDGYFKLEKAIDERTQSYLDVTFDRLAVICVAKTPKAIAEGMRKRTESVPPLVNYPSAPSRPYEGRNLSRIRLAFALTYQDSGDQWRVIQAFSDEISDKKENKALELEELNPTEASPRGGSEIAIYTKSATTGVSKTETTVSFLLEGEDKTSGTRLFVCAAKEIKKHLITVTAPDVRRFAANERTKFIVTVHVGDASSTELTIVFVAGLPVIPATEANSRKRAR